MPTPPPSLQMYGLNFGPYIDDDEDPRHGAGQITRSELVARLRAIAPHVEWVRTFACGGDLEPVGSLAHDLGLKAAVGAWMGPNSTENSRELRCLVRAAVDGNVDLAIVGSEALLRKDLPPSQLLANIRLVKSALIDAGRGDIPVTSADVYHVLLEHPAVLDEVDVVFGNFYPYWEGTALDAAPAELRRQYRMLASAVTPRQVIISETGWPSCGEPRGGAVPSPDNAAQYLSAVLSWAQDDAVKVFYFEAFDEHWKTAEGTLGTCWGVFDRSGVPKVGMRELLAGQAPTSRSDAGGPAALKTAATFP